MAKKSISKKEIVVLDLGHLKQVELAWLIARSPRWIREHSHIFERDNHGRYNGRQAVAALLHFELATRPPQILF